MKGTVARLALLAALLTMFGAAGLTAWFALLNPARATPADIRVEATPERIARGQYLYTLGDCDGCHSPRDFSRFAGPVVGRRGEGFVFPPEFGLPGLVVAPNITPDPETGLGRWTDGEKIRAIRDGIGRDGRALFPMMPYPFLSRMSDEDAASLVAYLNTLPPASSALPRTKLDFPASVLTRTAPRPVANVPEPDRSDPVAYGGYLVALSGCTECHTMDNKGRLRQDMLFAGGREFRMHGAVVVSSNITPDPETGIGKWSERDFVARFHAYRGYLKSGPPSVGPEGFTLMPWLNLSQLPPEDLKAMYAYLRAQRPVHNQVEVRPARR
jgi:mono/diheme cytochrome c family protein